MLTRSASRRIASSMSAVWLGGSVRSMPNADQPCCAATSARRRNVSCAFVGIFTAVLGGRVIAGTVPRCSARDHHGGPRTDPELVQRDLDEDAGQDGQHLEPPDVLLQ